MIEIYIFYDTSNNYTIIAHFSFLLTIDTLKCVLRVLQIHKISTKKIAPNHSVCNTYLKNSPREMKRSIKLPFLHLNDGKLLYISDLDRYFFQLVVHNQNNSVHVQI